MEAIQFKVEINRSRSGCRPAFVATTPPTTAWGRLESSEVNVESFSSKDSQFLPRYPDQLVVTETISY
jgi:hypothetical protein